MRYGNKLIPIMETFYDGYVEYDSTLSYTDDDILETLCSSAKQCFLTLSSSNSFDKAYVCTNIKAHNILCGEKERCMNIILEVWHSACDSDAFYQTILLRSGLSCTTITTLIELLNDMAAMTAIIVTVPLSTGY